jgi:hypothetical protein
MPSPFDALDAALSATCLGAFGEVASLVPRVASQYTVPQPDPARQQTDIVGIYSAGPGETPIKGKATGGDFTGPTRFVTTRAEFWVDAETMASLPYEIAKGDMLILTDRGDTPYEIIAAQPTDMGDVNLILAYERVPE